MVTIRAFIVRRTRCNLGGCEILNFRRAVFQGAGRKARGRYLVRRGGV